MRLHHGGKPLLLARDSLSSDLPNAGRKLLILVHGLCMNDLQWARNGHDHGTFLADALGYTPLYLNYNSGLSISDNGRSFAALIETLHEQWPTAIDEITIIGHSMGGMISRLLLTDSGMNIWNAFFDRAPDKIPFSKAARNLMSRSLIFKSDDDISRMVFLSASHRGSDMATGLMGRLGAMLVGNPISQSQVNKEVYSYVRPDVRVGGRHRLPNSIDMLDPENRFLLTANALPLKPGVPFHSLIGDRGRGGYLDHTKPASSDGVVAYWSSHVAGAQSEQIIPSGHWSFLNPLGMVEVKRILNENLQ
jgi:pimeloyl-ACP methyl ester carboxylesterase